MTDAVAQPINGSTSSMLPIVQQGIILAAQPPSHQPLGTIGPGPLLRSQLQKGLWSGNAMPLKRTWLIRSNGYSTSIISCSPVEDFFWTLPSLYYEAMKEEGVQLLWSLAKESNIGWKINRPQSSGWKPLLQLLQCLLGMGIKLREALETYQAQWETIWIVFPSRTWEISVCWNITKDESWLKTIVTSKRSLAVTTQGRYVAPQESPSSTTANLLIATGTQVETFLSLNAKSQLLAGCVDPRNSLKPGKAKGYSVSCSKPREGDEDAKGLWA